MAKKYQRRTHVSVRKKQEEEKKLAERRAFFAKHQKSISIGLIALAVVLLAVILLVYFFYAPAGAMNRAALSSAPENAIIRNLGSNGSPRYYTFGTMDTPAGYVPDTEFSTLTAPEQNFSFNAESEDRAIQSVYVTGVKNRTGADMAAEVAASSFYASISEVKRIEIAGYTLHYLYAQGNPNQEDDSIFYSVLVMYVDTLADSSILVNCSSAYAALEEIPSEEALLAEMEDILSCLKLP